MHVLNQMEDILVYLKTKKRERERERERKKMAMMFVWLKVDIK